MSEAKKAANFNIKIISRENQTWQGAIQWLDEGKAQNFRSALELIRLIDSALGTPDGGAQRE